MSACPPGYRDSSSTRGGSDMPDHLAHPRRASAFEAAA